MRILEIAPAGAPVTSESPNPIAATLAHLVDGLVERGHDVTLWADPRSQTAARLHTNGRVPPNDSPSEQGAFERLYAFAATSDQGEYDVVHNHAGATVAELLWRFNAPAFSTVSDQAGRTWRHGRFATPSWSRRQAIDGSASSFLGVLYPGVPVDELTFGEGAGGYLLYAAPISPAYGAHLAAIAARRLERPLRFIGPIASDCTAYYRELIEPHVRAGTAEYLGPLGQREVAEQAANALALLHPFSRHTGFDFGAVAAMAAGAPVVAYRVGAMPEIVLHGETGFLVDEAWQFAGAVDQVDLLDRRACRRRVQRLFDVQRMVADHEALYARLALGIGACDRWAMHPELEALDPRLPLLAESV
jgi:hypothetical protein